MFGVLEVSTYDGCKYYLSLLDDYTHFCTVYLMKHKSKITEQPKEYMEQMKSKWNWNVCKIRNEDLKSLVPFGGIKSIHKSLTRLQSWMDDIRRVILQVLSPLVKKVTENYSKKGEVCRAALWRISFFLLLSYMSIFNKFV